MLTLNWLNCSSLIFESSSRRIEVSGGGVLELGVFSPKQIVEGFKSFSDAFYPR